MTKAEIEKAARTRAGLDDPRVEILLRARELNPFLILKQGEEALLRKVRDETLSGYKRDGFLPRIAP